MSVEFNPDISQQRCIIFPVPDWVRWIAQDADGVWWGYQAEPNLSHRSWYENEVGHNVRLGKGEQNPDWVSTLERVR